MLGSSVLTSEYALNNRVRLITREYGSLCDSSFRLSSCGQPGPHEYLILVPSPFKNFDAVHFLQSFSIITHTLLFYYLLLLLLLFVVVFLGGGSVAYAEKAHAVSGSFFL